MLSGGVSILSGSTSFVYLIFYVPGINCILKGHCLFFFSMQCSLSALLSDYRRSRAILFSVWPPCWPSSIPVTFRLSHTNQLYSAYLIFLRSRPCFHKYLLQQQQQLFYGPLSGTTRVSRYQKKHSPTRHPDHHPIFISFFHLVRIHSILPVQIECLAIFNNP